MISIGPTCRCVQQVLQDKLPSDKYPDLVQRWEPEGRWCVTRVTVSVSSFWLSAKSRLQRCTRWNVRGPFLWPASVFRNYTWRDKQKHKLLNCSTFTTAAGKKNRAESRGAATAWALRWFKSKQQNVLWTRTGDTIKCYYNFIKFLFNIYFVGIVS